MFAEAWLAPFITETKLREQLGDLFQIIVGVKHVWLLPARTHTSIEGWIVGVGRIKQHKSNPEYFA